MNYRKLIANTVIFGFLSIPLVMFLLWLFTPSTAIKALIVDKTVLSEDCNEHYSLNWILKHEKYKKPDGSYYSAAKDYFGFFPGGDKKFTIKDLSGLSSFQLDSVSDYYQIGYFADTYGIYYNEWYLDTFVNEYSTKVYGGMHMNDYELIRRMKEKRKLVIAEFNLFSAPTSPDIRKKTEDLFHVKWSGWVGRYFESLDTLNNPDLPAWTVCLYTKQFEKPWGFKNSGIILIHEDETIVVLENKTHLKEESPLLKTFDYGREKFGLPEKTYYPFWFEINTATDTTNRVVSYFEIMPTGKGDSLLMAFKVPRIFPAVFECLTNETSYYFCGDFCDNPVKGRFFPFKGIDLFEIFVLNTEESQDRSHFFWRYYKPLMQNILKTCVKS